MSNRTGERIYTCPMHPEVRERKPGECPICGMALEPDIAEAEEETNPELAYMSRRFWISLLFTVPLLVLAMGGMLAPTIGGSFALHWEAHLTPMTQAWIQLALAAPVVLWGGWPFFVRGWRSLVSRRLNMFTLIAMGTAVAFGFSVFAMLFPAALPHLLRHGSTLPVYFEAAAVITTLVLLGQVLELRARSASSGAIRALLGMQPKTARRVLDGGNDEDVPLAHIHPGDKLRVRPGERVPRRNELHRRVHDQRRGDACAEDGWRAGHRRNGQFDRQLRDARGACGRRHATRPDRAHGLRGAAQPSTDPEARGRRLLLVRAVGNPSRGTGLLRLGVLRARAAPGLRAGQRSRGAHHRLPMRPGPGHADVDHGRHGPGRPCRRPREKRRGSRGSGEGRHPRHRQDGHTHRGQAPPGLGHGIRHLQRGAGSRAGSRP